MTTDNKTDFGDIPEEHHGAVTGLIEAATKTLGEKLEGDIQSLKTSQGETIGGLRETNRKNELEIARLTDKDGNNNELTGTVADTIARHKMEDSEAAMKIREDEANSKIKAADATLLMAAKTAAIASGMSEEVANAAESERELKLISTILNAAGGSNSGPNKNANGNRNPGATIPGSGSTQGNKPNLSTREGEMEHWSRDLIKAGLDPNERID
jgi:hypothetical protein